MRVTAPALDPPTTPLRWSPHRTLPGRPTLTNVTVPLDHTRVTAGPEKVVYERAASPAPTRSRSGHPVGKPRRRRRPRRRPPRPCALLPSRTRIHRHPAHPHRRHRLQTPRHHQLPHQTHRRAHHHRNACRTVKLTKGLGLTDKGRTPAKSTRAILHTTCCRRHHPGFECALPFEGSKKMARCQTIGSTSTPPALTPTTETWLQKLWPASRAKP